MRTCYLFLMLALACCALGCVPEPPKSVAKEKPRELTPGDIEFLRARGVEDFYGEKAKSFLRQRDYAQKGVREAQKRQYDRVMERQKKAAAKK